MGVLHHLFSSLGPAGMPRDATWMPGLMTV